MSAAGSVAGGTAGGRRDIRPPRRPWTPVLLLLPAAVALAAVAVYPIADGFWLSLRDTSLATQDDNFVGLANYAQLAGDAGFWNAWRHTVVFTAVSTALETLIGLGMALVLYESFAGRSVVRAAMLVPWAMPTVVTSKMFGWLFDGQNGVVNWLLRQAASSATTSTGTARPTTRSPPSSSRTCGRRRRSWRSCSWPGCRRCRARWSRRRGSTAPTLGRFLARAPAPAWATLLIAGMFRALDSFRIFDLVYVLTGGGPADSTETLSTLSYKTLFSRPVRLGSALSTAMFATEVLIALGFGVLIVRKMRRDRVGTPGVVSAPGRTASPALITLGAVGILVWSAAPSCGSSRPPSSSTGADRPTPSLLPSPWTLEHYRNIFVEKSSSSTSLNSLIVAAHHALRCAWVRSPRSPSRG